MRDILMRNLMLERMCNWKVKKRIVNLFILTNVWRIRWRATIRNNFCC